MGGPAYIVFLPPPSLSEFTSGWTWQKTTLNTSQMLPVKTVPDSNESEIRHYDESWVQTCQSQQALSQSPLQCRSGPFRALRPEQQHAKKVRIKSPVLVAETPERPPKRHAFCALPPQEGWADKSSVNLGQDHDEEQDGLADKSRVVLDDDDDDESMHRNDTSYIEDHGDSIPQDDTATSMLRPQANASVYRFSFFSAEKNKAKAIPPAKTTEQLLATLAETTTADQSRLPTIAISAAEQVLTTRSRERISDSRTIDLLNAIGGEEPRRRPDLDRLRGDTSKARSTIIYGSGESYGDSIPPPPTLDFALSSITTISRILSNPSSFLNLGFGGGNAKVNLLTVIREVGEMSYVKLKYPTDTVHTGFKSNKLAAAIQRERKRMGGTAVHAGKTERRELVVMDGRPDDAVRQSEKYFFRVVLWGRTANEWTGGSDDMLDHGDLNALDRSKRVIENSSSEDVSLDDRTRYSEASSSESAVITSTEPTSLRIGDVVYLRNVSLVNTSTNTSHPAVAARRSRLGAGFPRPPAEINLIGYASERNSSSIELCYRTLTITPSDRKRNFDPEVAKFDVKSRRVKELSTLWEQSRVQ